MAAKKKTFRDIDKFDKSEMIRELTSFYKNADNGAYRKYLAEFLNAVKESGY